MMGLQVYLRLAVRASVYPAPGDRNRIEGQGAASNGCHIRNTLSARVRVEHPEDHIAGRPR
eukprot:4729682-Alexandrium_andersonii.AAC.1